MTKSKEKLETMIKNATELKEDELENVTGGLLHCSESYDQLGIDYSVEYGQKGWYFPIFVNIFPCSISNGEECKDCIWVHKVGGNPYYCKARSAQHDPCNE